MRSARAFTGGLFVTAASHLVIGWFGLSGLPRDLIEWIPWAVLAGMMAVVAFTGRLSLPRVLFMSGLVLVPLVILSIHAVRPYMDRNARIIPFDAVKWRDALHERKNDPNPLRLGMALDLIRSARLEGASRDAVLELLGPPDSRRFQDLSIPEGNLVYLLNPGGSGASVDVEVLRLQFDRTGILKTCWIEII